jgi:hypothetical protein
VRPDPCGASDDSKLPLDVLARETKYLIGSPIGWRGALQALSHGGSTIPPWCRPRVGTVESFHNVDICRCRDAKT